MFRTMADTAIANQENIMPESLDKPKKPSSGDDQHFRIIRTLGEGQFLLVLIVFQSIMPV